VNIGVDDPQQSRQAPPATSPGGPPMFLDGLRPAGTTDPTP
jgi:hypothetical protein